MASYEQGAVGLQQTISRFNWTLWDKLCRLGSSAIKKKLVFMVCRTTESPKRGRVLVGFGMIDRTDASGCAPDRTPGSRTAAMTK